MCVCWNYFEKNKKNYKKIFFYKKVIKFLKNMNYQLLIFNLKILII